MMQCGNFMVNAADSPADFHADIIYVERREVEPYEREILSALMPDDNTEYLDTVYLYDMKTGEKRKMWSPGTVLDVLKKGSSWYIVTDEAMLYENRAEKSTVKLPQPCDDAVKNISPEFYTQNYCDFGFKDGKFFMQHNRQDTTVKMSKIEGFNLMQADETHKITRTFYESDGEKFVQKNQSVDIPKFGWVEEFAGMAADFQATLDTDYFSLNRKMNEADWDYRYDGKPAYYGWLSTEDGNPWASGDTIKLLGDDIEINAKVSMKGAEEKEVKFRLKDFLETESITKYSNREKKDYPRSYMLFEAAGGKYYVMANTEFGDTPHLTDYFYILKPGETSFVKIEPPKSDEHPQQIGITLSPDHIIVQANEGKFYLYGLDGKLAKAFEGDIRKMAFM
jgi:hypothetical protein